MIFMEKRDWTLTTKLLNYNLKVYRVQDIIIAKSLEKKHHAKVVMVNK